MRIISQDGTIDMPYEICSVWCHGSVIMCDMCGDNTNTILATYSAEEKAKKAMKMLREDYKRCEVCHYLKAFQFPAEEELE
jgi:hypothetical protein